MARFHPYHGNQITRREIKEVLLNLIKRTDYLDTIKELKYKKKYLSITSYAANRIEYLKEEAKESEKRGDPRYPEFLKLIKKLENAKSIAKNRILQEEEEEKRRIEEIQKHYDPNTGLTIPVEYRISPKKAPKTIKGTITGPSAPPGSQYHAPKKSSKIFPSNEG